MQIIVSHANPDFDAFASMVAASKLHPDAVVVIVDSPSITVQRYLAHYPFPNPPQPSSTIDPTDVTELIVVDTSQPQRLGSFATLYGMVPTTIYDHHPLPETELPPNALIEMNICSCGSNAAFMTQLLRQKSHAITPALATLLMTGIHEDTGHLLYRSTTPLDYQSAAYLLECGAEMEVVDRLLARHWQDAEIHILSDLLRHSETRMILGVNVALCYADFHQYVPDVSGMLGNIMTMKESDLLCALLRMEGRIYAIVRSKCFVSAREVAAIFNGDGHRDAASATVHHMTLLQAVEAFWLQMKAVVARMKQAATIMSAPPKVITLHSTIASVCAFLGREGLNCLPVVNRNDTLYGIVGKTAAFKAREHGLGMEEIASIAETEITSLPPEAPFDAIEAVLLRGLQGLIPIVNAEKKVVGVITRTDLLREYRYETDSKTVAQKREAEAGPQQKNVYRLLGEVAGAHVRQLLESIAAIANEAERNVYLVGGVVRDLMMRRPNHDIDLVVEGEGITFATQIAQKLGGRINTHERFGTSIVILADGKRVDIASSRSEYYEHPGALPTVSLSSIKRDLYRRDFTINAMAISLNTFALVDFFGGMQDIRDRRIRILHSLSFIDDPTRMFRAVRFEQRYDFPIGDQTLRLIKSARDLDLLQHVSHKRLYDELRHMFTEARPTKCLRRLFELRLMQGLHPELVYDAKTMTLIDTLEELLIAYDFLAPALERKDILYLTLLLRTMDTDTRESFPILRETPKKYAAIVRYGYGQAGDIIFSLGREKEFWKQLQIASKPPVEIILLALARGKNTLGAQFLQEYLCRYRYQRPQLKGNDLIALGVPVGKAIERGLFELWAFVACSQTPPARDEEERWAKHQLVPRLTAQE
ncbi:CBS domain-containing protein [Chrysiogenes arsenatis]|uniref:CBS domain-containing protein n=1 Tax=Chrysiogenes arsenatis TaxID=309797 RepID=UPI0003FC5567|nr:CBS domain-containing protein [Chrysiogenes arsenatis]